MREKVQKKVAVPMSLMMYYDNGNAKNTQRKRYIEVSKILRGGDRNKFQNNNNSFISNSNNNSYLSSTSHLGNNNYSSHPGKAEETEDTHQQNGKEKTS